MDETKRTGFGVKFLKVLLAIVVPLLFLLLLIALFLKLSGLDPVQEAKHLIFRDSTGSTVQPADGSTSEVEQLKAQVSDQEKTIKQLQDDKSKLTDQVASLTNQLNQEQSDSTAKSSQAKSSQAAAKQAVYAQTYKAMDPEKAAAIFEKLSVKQAAEYLNYLDDKTKASILENMSADTAAKLTPLLKPNTAATGSTTTSSSTTTATGSSGAADTTGATTTVSN